MSEVWDECSICGGRILWAPGGEVWLHEAAGRDHLAVPVVRVDLKTRE